MNELYLSPAIIRCCKPDCPRRSATCHSGCNDYKNELAEAEQIKAKVRMQKKIDEIANELKGKNHERFGGG